jgi:hypothetical protein
MFAAFNGIDDSVFHFSLVRNAEYCWLLLTLHMGHVPLPMMPRGWEWRV